MAKSPTGNPFIKSKDNPGQLGLGSLPRTPGGLQKISVASGAASGSLIEVDGMRAVDIIESAIAWDSGVPADVTADVTSVAASGFKLSADTSGKSILVWWLDQVAYDG